MLLEARFTSEGQATFFTDLFHAAVDAFVVLERVEIFEGFVADGALVRTGVLVDALVSLHVGVLVEARGAD